MMAILAKLAIIAIIATLLLSYPLSIYYTLYLISKLYYEKRNYRMAHGPLRRQRIRSVLLPER